MPFIMNTMFDRSCLVSEESNITVSKQTNKKGGGRMWMWMSGHAIQCQCYCCTKKAVYKFHLSSLSKLPHYTIFTINLAAVDYIMKAKTASGIKWATQGQQVGWVLIQNPLPWSMMPNMNASKVPLHLTMAHTWHNDRFTDL